MSRYQKESGREEKRDRGRERREKDERERARERGGEGEGQIERGGWWEPGRGEVQVKRRGE